MLTNSLACSASTVFALGLGGVFGCVALRKDGNHELEVEGVLLDAMFVGGSRGWVVSFRLKFPVFTFTREVVGWLLFV